MSKENLEIFDANIKIFQEMIPSDFNRKLEGGRATISFWKATEYRCFALYGGIVTLRNSLPYELYANYLELACAMRMLLVDGSDPDRIKQILRNFFVNARRLLGKEFISYNVHSLVHLHDDYRRYGNLNDVSTFPFENYLGVLKRKVMGTNKVFAQVTTHALRLNELKTPASNCSRLLKVDEQRNSGVMLRDGRVARVANKAEDVLTLECFRVKNLFDYPVRSKEVGVFKLKQTRQVAIVNVKDVMAKVIICRSGNVLAGVKLLSH